MKRKQKRASKARISACAKPASKAVPVIPLFREFYLSRGFSASRTRHYETACRMLERYESRFGLRLDARGVDSARLASMLSFIREEPGHYGPRSDNYLHGIFKMYRAFFNWCRKTGIRRDDPFTGFSMPRETYGTPVILSLDEFHAVASCRLPSGHLDRIRDIFVFQCCVGSRAGDLFSFTKDSVRDGVLEYVAGKTASFDGRTVSVPLNGLAISVLDKYASLPGEALLPKVSLQVYNRDIKKVFLAAGIDRMVSVYDPRTRSTARRPLYEVASSHLARRTFIGNLYRRVKDPSLIGSMSGHAEGSRAFARYRDIDMATKRELVAYLEGD